ESLSLSFRPPSVCEPRKGRIASSPAERAKARRCGAPVSWFVWLDCTLSLVFSVEATCSDAKAVPVIVSLPARIKAAKSSVLIFIIFTAFPVKAYSTRPEPPACRLPPTPGHEDRQVKADVLITAVERIFMSRFPSSMPPAKKIYFVISLCITVRSRLYSQEPSLLTCQTQANRGRGR